MLDDLRVAWWEARLSDGSEWTNASSELHGRGMSPWMSLEEAARERTAAVDMAVLRWGAWELAQDADGGRLVCGTTLDMELTLGGANRQVEYRFLLCEKPSEWVWAITDGIRWWEVRESPGLFGHEKMPSVAGLTPQGGPA